MQETPHVPFHAGAQRYLSRTEAAQYIRSRYGFPCSRQWLAKLAVLGGGPISARPVATRFTRLPTLMTGRWPGRQAAEIDLRCAVHYQCIGREQGLKGGHATPELQARRDSIGRIRSMTSRDCSRIHPNTVRAWSSRASSRSTIDGRLSSRVMCWRRSCGRAVKRPSGHAAPAKFTACPAADRSDRRAASWNIARPHRPPGTSVASARAATGAIHRRVNREALSVVTRDLEVTLAAPAPRLLETRDLPVNCELESEEAA